MTLRAFGATGLLVVLGFSLAVGAAEVILRVTERNLGPQEYVAFQKSQTPGLDYEFVPGVRVPWANREIRINAQGFRGPDFPPDVNALPRVAIIGDSIAAGYGVAEDEAFPFRMVDLMRDQDLPAEVLAFAVPGYNIQRIAVLWEQRVRPYRPSVVVYAMCLNDARPELTLNADGVLVAAAGVELTPERSRPGRLPIPGKAWLAERSLLYALAVSRYDLLLRRLGFRAEPLPPLEEIERLYADSTEGRRFADALGRMAASVAAAGSKLVLVCFPSEGQLKAGRAQPQAALALLAERLGVEFLDLYPVFLSATRDRRGGLFGPDGIHPNARGHAVAASGLIRALRPLVRGAATSQRLGPGPETRLAQPSAEPNASENGRQ